MSPFFSPEHLANLYQKAPCGFLITTLDGVICGGNKTFLSWTEQDEESVIGKNIRDLLSPASKLFYDTYYMALLQADRVNGVAMELRRNASSAFPVLVTSRTEHDTQHSTDYIHSTLFDASERRDSERALVMAKRRADTLADVVRSSPHAILTTDYDLRLQTWNGAAIRLLSKQGELLAGSSLSCHLPEAILELLVTSLEQDCAVVEHVTLSSGIVCQMSAYPMKEGLAIYLADVTKQVATQHALKQAHDRFTLATMATTDGIWDWNRETGIVYLSGRAQAMLGYSPEAIELPLRRVLRRFHVKDFVSIRSTFLTTRRSEDRIDTEWRVRHRDGNWRWLHSRGMVLHEQERRSFRMVGSLTDITDRRTEDPLTGLHTRMSLLDRLEWRLAAEDRFKLPCALLFMDIDGFKKVNDGLGHAAGDTLLVRIASRLETVANSKVGSLTARLGGDEFVVLLEEVTGSEEIVDFVEKLQRAIHMPIDVAGQQLSICISVGVALSRLSKCTAEELLHNADTAMYRAKAAGKGRHLVFNEEMQRAAHKRLTLEADLFRAVHDGTLQLYYQPKINLASGLTIGYEALARWRHPVYGMITPDLFIAIAEDSSLIRDIGRWTIFEAMRQMAHWQKSGFAPSTATISINLSPKQFEDSELIEVVQGNLSRFDLAPSCVHFEVTEGVLIGNVDTALSVLKKLKFVGVGLELDDFGKGYSSLSYLHQYPFDVLKIDRSFVSDLGVKKDADAIVQTIITLAEALKLHVIAEGVETKAQEQILRTLGCPTGQGYLYSKAVPPEMVEQVSKFLKEPCEAQAAELPCLDLQLEHAGVQATR